jgi:hypothetical protein
MVASNGHRGLRVFLPLLVLLISSSAVGFRYSPVVAFESFSDNRAFVARVEPDKSGKVRPATLELFKNEGGKRVSQWRLEVSNQISPYEVLVTDDGQYVVTLDSHDRIGYGDDVVAIYAKAGLIRKYSLEAIIGEAAGQVRLDRSGVLFRRDRSSRYWREGSIMSLKREGTEARFGIWLGWAQRWYVWKLADGSMESVEGDALKQWNEIGSLWAHAKLGDVLVSAKAANSTRSDSVYSAVYDDQVLACRFLGFVKNPADRKLLERLFQREERVSRIRPELRKAADTALTMLDQVDARVEEAKGGVPRVGSVTVKIKFPRRPDTGEGKLRYYVFPERVNADWWREATPVFHARASADLRLYGDAGDRKDVQILGLRPGRYWVKVVWDRRTPEDLQSEKLIEMIRQGQRHEKETPEAGAGPKDFESAGAQVFEIEAGKVIEIEIACDRAGGHPPIQR